MSLCDNHSPVRPCALKSRCVRVTLPEFLFLCQKKIKKIFLQFSEFSFTLWREYTTDGEDICQFIYSMRECFHTIETETGTAVSCHYGLPLICTAICYRTLDDACWMLDSIKLLREPRTCGTICSSNFIRSNMAQLGQVTGYSVRSLLIRKILLRQSCETPVLK